LADVPIAYRQHRLCKAMGWTLGYVEGMPWHKFLQTELFLAAETDPDLTGDSADFDSGGEWRP
jgi:hypothetical protein